MNDPSVDDGHPGADGDVFIVERANANHRVQRFDSDGGFVLMWGHDVIAPGRPGDLGAVFEVCSVAADCQANGPGSGPGELDGPSGVAVDQSDGSVYVLDRSNRRIQRYTPDGELVAVYGDGVNVDTGADRCTVASGDVCGLGTHGSGAGQFSAFSGQPKLDVIQSGVDAGELVLGDRGNRRVLQFDPDAADPADVFVRGWGWDVIPAGAAQFEICTTATGCQAGQTSGGAANGAFASNQPSHVATDSTGRVYASDTGASNRVLVFDSTAATAVDLLEAPVGAIVDGGPLIDGSIEGLAVDHGTDNLFVIRRPPAFSAEALVQEINQAGEEVAASPHGVGARFDDLTTGSGTRAIDVDGTSGRLYLPYASGGFGQGYFVLDDDGAQPPVVDMQPATAVGAHEATLHATIVPLGAAKYRFQYSKTGVEGSWVDVSDPVQVSGDDPIAVQATATGLEANTVYKTRIVTAKPTDAAGGELVDTSAEVPVATDIVPPEVITGAAQHVGARAATLTGLLNPNNLPTGYRFEYGTTASYGSQTALENATGGVERKVAARIEGLEPLTTYHYRLRADNTDPHDAAVGGAALGLDGVFTTRSAIDPPPGRAYEMVTPPYKNNRVGGDDRPREELIPETGLPSPDGETVYFALFAAVVDPAGGTAFPFTTDALVVERVDGQGWEGRSIQDRVALQPAGDKPISQLVATSSDFGAHVWAHHKSLFESGSHLSNRVMEGPDAGWYDWTAGADPAVTGGLGTNSDVGLVDEEGARALRWSDDYAGLLGPDPLDDPSVAQVSGSAAYVQEPVGGGLRHLINGCTDAGGPTQVPARVGSGVSGDTIGARDCSAGEPTSSRGGVVGSGRYFIRAMSTDGKRVFFTSPDPAEAPSSCGAGTGAATRCPAQLYVRQYDSSAVGTHGVARVRWISRPQVTGAQNHALLRETVYEGASEDGRYVFFRAQSPLTDDDPNGGNSITAGPVAADSWDLYRYELPPGPDGVHGTPDDVDADPADGALMRISGGHGGTADPNVTAGTGTQVARQVSDDGERVYFVTRGPLTDGQADNTVPAGSSAGNAPSGSPTASDARNLYLFDGDKSGKGRWKFVARLPLAGGSGSDRAVDTCATQASAPGASLNGGGSVGNDGVVRTSSSCVRGDTAGRYLVFESTGRLTADDVDDAGDVFLYDAVADELVRVSAAAGDAQPYQCNEEFNGRVEFCNADLGWAAIGAGGGSYGLGGTRHQNVAVDESGVVSVFFESRSRLVADDVNGDYWDTYRWRNGELSLISPGATDDHAWFSGNSTDGQDVFFLTSARLDPREVDPADIDIYDARVGGGFPPPAAPPEGCDALGGCQGDGGGVWSPPAPASGSPTADGNAGDGAGARRVLSVATPSRRARARAARTGALALRVRAGGAGRLVAVARARLGGRVRPVGRGRARVDAGSGRVVVRLSRRARRRLAAGRPLRVRVTVVLRGVGRDRVTFVLRRRGGRR